MPPQNAKAMIEPLLLRARTLQTEIESARSELEGVKTWTILNVHRRVRSFEGKRREIDAKTTELHADMNSYLDGLKIEPPTGGRSIGSILGVEMPQYFVELSRVSRNSTQCLLAIQHLQDASSGLGALIERKYAYAFAFISLYFGIVLTIVSTAVGLQAGASAGNLSAKHPCSWSAK